MQTLLLRTLFNSAKSLASLKSAPKSIYYAPLVQLKLAYSSTSSAGGLDVVGGAPFVPLTVKLFSTETSSSPNELNLDQLAQKAENILKQRQVNPFTLYVKENYRNVAEQNPDAKNKSLIGLMASQWRTMTIEQKMAYLDKASDNKQANKLELDTLYANLSQDQLKEVKKKLSEKRSARRKLLAKKRTKREVIKLQKPKRPLSAFLLYSQSLDRGEAGLTDFSKGASLKWKALALEDKEKFVIQSKEMQEKYRKDLRAWEAKMLAEGREKLVRRSFLREMEKSLSKKKMEKLKERMETAEKTVKKKVELLQRQIVKLKQAKAKSRSTKKRPATKSKSKSK